MATQQLIISGQFFDMARVADAVDRWLNGIGNEDAYLIYVHGKG